MYHYDALTAIKSQSDLHPGSSHIADVDPAENNEMYNRSESCTKASAKPEEAMCAEVAAQGHHADDAQQDIEQSAMRPPDTALTALWT